MSGLLTLLFLFRLIKRSGVAISTWSIAALAITSAVLTALIEAGWYGLTRNIDPLLILPANFDFDIGVRPAWYVFGWGLGFTALNAVWPLPAGNRRKACDRDANS